jgi:hypothetical protein
MVGLQRKRTIRAFFKNNDDAGFPSRASLAGAKRLGFETLDEFWEHYNGLYEERVAHQREDARPQKDEKKRAYNKERNKKIREKGKTFSVNLADFLKEPKYYQEAPKFEKQKSTQRVVNATQKAFMKKVLEMKGAGRVEISGTPNEMFNTLDGMQGKLHVSYITKDGLYRGGGFLRMGKDDASKAQMRKDGYITLYIPDKKLSFPVQLNKVDVLYVKTVENNYELKATEQRPTKYPVELGGFIVCYARDSYAKNRFIASKKYAILKKKADELKEV